jgi:hypothetical protein
VQCPAQKTAKKESKKSNLPFHQGLIVPVAANDFIKKSK